MRFASLLGLAAIASGVGAGMSACSSPSLNGTNFACTNDADCTGGSVCGTLSTGARACVQRADAGAADAGDTSPIRIGMSTALSGTSGDLGTQMSRGVHACLDNVNRAGGVRGRKLELTVRDDAYDPTRAETNTRELLDVQQIVSDPEKPDVRGPNGVIALLGNVGTPTMAKSAPIAIKNHVLFFGAFTGAQTILRDGTRSPYVFNYRAGYYDETRAMLAYLKRRNNGVLPDQKNVLVFAQKDAYGDAGYAGMKNAFAEAGGASDQLTRIDYVRDDLTSVAPAVTAAKTALAGADASKPIAVVMIDTYQIGAAFTRALKNELANGAGATSETRALARKVLYMHVSFVGSEGLQDELGKPPQTYDAGGQQVNYSENVWVTQVVPSYESLAPGVAQYRNDIQALDGGKIGFVSLEGHIACRLFVEGLKANQSDQTPDNLVKAFETINNLDLGIGTLLRFDATDHQASQQVWFSSFGGEDLTGDPLKYYITLKWNRTTGIEPD